MNHDDLVQELEHRFTRESLEFPQQNSLQAPSAAEAVNPNDRLEITDRDALMARLRKGQTAAYCGFDPTATSLHVGSLQALVVLRMFQRYGHVPIALIGGATGFIGDPSGKSKERNLLDAETLDRNRASVRAQIERLLPATSGCMAPFVVDNRDWFERMTVIEFLRDIGKHFSVNSMIHRDCVSLRLNSSAGISFTEFSYSLFQAYDFVHLRRTLGCCVQLGGRDQLGNIAAGLDLARRLDAGDVYGIAWPLLAKSDGTKFGKTTEGNVWLDASLTSAFRFYQFWLGVPDDEVNALLRRFTFVPLEEIETTMSEQLAHPGRRVAQRRLAFELTAWVHGRETAASVASASDALFSSGGAALSAEMAAMLASEVPTTRIGFGELQGLDVLTLALRCGVTSSRGEARRFAAAGAFYLDGRRVDERAAVGLEIARRGFGVLRKGARTAHLILCTG